MSDATPRPWDFDEEDRALYSLEETEIVGDWASPPTLADIQFIVRAVNAHDALLEAAEWGHRILLDRELCCEETDAGTKPCALRAAIHLAKGDQP